MSNVMQCKFNADLAKFLQALSVVFTNVADIRERTAELQADIIKDPATAKYSNLVSVDIKESVVHICNQSDEFATNRESCQLFKFLYIADIYPCLDVPERELLWSNLQPLTKSLVLISSLGGILPEFEDIAASFLEHNKENMRGNTKMDIMKSLLADDVMKTKVLKLVSNPDTIQQLLSSIGPIVQTTLGASDTRTRSDINDQPSSPIGCSDIRPTTSDFKTAAELSKSIQNTIQQGALRSDRSPTPTINDFIQSMSTMKLDTEEMAELQTEITEVIQSMNGDGPTDCKMQSMIDTFGSVLGGSKGQALAGVLDMFKNMTM
jgi:hypothetical protein